MLVPPGAALYWGGNAFTSGDIALWLMNGTAIQSASVIGNVPASWVIQGINAD
jgi:hypothetical protein